MDNGENSGRPGGKNTDLPEKQRDFWDKAEIASKFLVAILVGIIGFWGNSFLQQKQKDDNNLKLYTQLLSNKETAENTLRKDMFGKILESFLEPRNVKNADGQKSLVKIREMRLHLELLSRNFHESLDIKPLFKHLLMDIVRPVVKLKKLLRELVNCVQVTDDRVCSVEKIKAFAQEVQSATKGEIEANQIVPENVSAHNIKQVEKLLEDYYRELDLLVKAAKRVTQKQREILEDVAGELRLTINLKQGWSEKICTEYTPLDWLPGDGICEKKDEGQNRVDEKAFRLVEGVEKSGILWFVDSDGQRDETSLRYFLMRVRYVYPKWKQVYVEILTCPVEPDITMTEENCKNKCKEYPKINNKAGFWLEHFDFPLVDNTYINSSQRYSVILEGFDMDAKGEAEKVKITLLYYPSSYSGLREKSFYNNQLMRSLLKSEFFQKPTDKKEKPDLVPPVLKNNGH